MTVEGWSLDGPVRFQCTACGQCCKTPPPMTLDELPYQAENFVLGARLKVIPWVDPQNADDLALLRSTYSDLDLAEPATAQSVADHLNRIAEAQGVEIGAPSATGSRTFLSLDFADIDQLSGACPRKLPDGGCDIYEKRPRACRAAPIDSTLPEALLGESLHCEIWKMRVRGGGCDVGPSAPVIWADGALIYGEDRDDHAHMGAGMPERLGLLCKQIVVEYLEWSARQSGVSRREIETRIQRAAASGDTPVQPLYPALARLIGNGELTSLEASDILMTQASLIEERLKTIQNDAPIKGADAAEMAPMMREWRDAYLRISDNWGRRT